MANRTPVHATAVKTCVFLHLLVFLAESAKEGSLYMWIDSNQARTLIGFEEDILIVSEGKMAPFTHDFRKAQQRMPAIPVNIQHMNFTWQATGQAEYFYEFQALRSLDKDVMGDPTVNVPLLGMVSHKPSVVQIGFPCLGNQDGVAAFEVTILVMDAEGNIILRTPHNAIFFKTCQRALCAPRCLNGGLCVSPGMCICPPGYYGINCDKGKCRQPCRNGGKCTGRNKCKCPKGFLGDLCSKGYRASVMSALRPTSTKHKLHTPSPKEADEGKNPPETNYIL
ncbi:Wnt inhibitory factor 1 [Acipenser ruthenus]|uniref:Wnt inhibitory factor 1 n=1 Tax=Acipenser ruthenus TaxID=7906 RepID=A0A662YPI5_ACIRT|nr:Wnt inhibitory factor 1 [Acipenser ruthenus]